MADVYVQKLEDTFSSSLLPLTFIIQAKVHWWFSYFKLMLCSQTLFKPAEFHFKF